MPFDCPIPSGQGRTGESALKHTACTHSQEGLSRKVYKKMLSAFLIYHSMYMYYNQPRRNNCKKRVLPSPARCDWSIIGWTMRRRALINQLLTCDSVRPVCSASSFFCSSEGYGCCERERARFTSQLHVHRMQRRWRNSMLATFITVEWTKLICKSYISSSFT